MTTERVICCAAVALMVGLLYGAVRVSGTPGLSRDEARTRLVAELEDFSGFGAHRALLNNVLDREGDEAWKATFGDGVWTGELCDGDWRRYRALMYRACINELAETGDKSAAVRLDRFRARTATWL
jgi:hypothetical protein